MMHSVLFIFCDGRRQRHDVPGGTSVYLLYDEVPSEDPLGFPRLETIMFRSVRIAHPPDWMGPSETHRETLPAESYGRMFPGGMPGGPMIVETYFLEDLDDGAVKAFREKWR